MYAQARYRLLVLERVGNCIAIYYYSRGTAGNRFPGIAMRLEQALARPPVRVPPHLKPEEDELISARVGLRVSDPVYNDSSLHHGMIVDQVLL